MSIGLLILEILTYMLVLWLGLYLLARNLSSPQLRWAGLGLVAYALNLAVDLLANLAPTSDLALLLTRLHWPLLFLPALLWFGAVVYRLPEAESLTATLRTLVNFVLLPVALPFYLFSAGTNWVFDFSQFPPQPGPFYLAFAAAILIPMLAALAVAVQSFRAAQPKKPLGFLLLATLFFGLSAGLMTLPLNWLPRTWLLLGVSVDFIILGLAIAVLDAFDEGETLLPDFLRSLTASIFASLLFGSLVLLTMLLATGVTFSIVALLVITLAASIFSQTFADQLQDAVDALAFSAFPQLRQVRADLRKMAGTLPRVNQSLPLDDLDEEEFDRLTRRALSHMGNLPRLATNPLTRLPMIEDRLAERAADDNTLERAAELKRLLTESIEQLKPPDKGDFGTSEEWRHYNALYFPYVVGLKPYSRRTEHNGLEPASQEALDWFRTYIPERTLYNWQTAAAKLVAQHLREQMG